MPHLRGTVKFLPIPRRFCGRAKLRPGSTVGMDVAEKRSGGLFKAFEAVFKPVLRGVACNAAHPSLLIGVAVNSEVPAISQEAGDNWLLLSPYGRTAYQREEKPGEWKQYEQVFERPQAQQMVRAFNSLREKKGAQWRGLPIYRGHPDCDPTRWPDDRRLGGVMETDARADGLYVRAAWNDDGEKNRAQGYLVYPSPAWNYSRRAASRTGRIEPDELKSVGMTNSPNIPDVDAWTNSTAAAGTAEDDNPMIKKKLTKILGLPEDATDEQIDAAYNAHFTGDVTAISLTATAANAATARTVADTARSNAEAARTEAEGRVTAITTERDAFRRTAMNSLLDGAINAGRLTAAERPDFERQFAANFDAAATALAAKRGALPHQDVRIERSQDDLSTPGKRSVAFNSRLAEIMAEKKVGPNDAMTLMATDSRGSLILKAMEDADKTSAANAK